MDTDQIRLLYDIARDPDTGMAQRYAQDTLAGALFVMMVNLRESLPPDVKEAMLPCAAPSGQAGGSNPRSQLGQ